MSGRFTYDHDQLEGYFDRICLPRAQRVYDVASLSDDEKLSFLSLLQKHQLVKVPWENLTQHYSWHRVINVKPRHLFKKITGNPGRGGYCMEGNYFFHIILHSLKFDTYMAGSRIWHDDEGKYGGWTHVVNLVTIAQKRYLLDGGYGPQGPSRPMPLDPGVTTVQIAPAEMRLLYEPLAQNLDQTQRVWIYQHRYNESSSWAPHYCFVDLEFTPEDIVSMNFAPWLDKQSFFAHKVACNRFTTDKERLDADGPGSPGEEAMTGEIDGAVYINQNVLKWRRNGKKVVDLPFKTEKARVEALEKYFGVIISEEDQEAIDGTASQIGVGGMSIVLD